MEPADQHINLTEDKAFQFNFTYVIVIIILVCLAISTFLFVKGSSNKKSFLENDIYKEQNKATKQTQPLNSSTMNAQGKTWQIELTDDPNLSNLQYYNEPSSTPQNDTFPIAGDRPPSISGNIITPLQPTDYYCSFYKNDRDGAVLETNIDNNWVTADICPVQPQRTRSDMLYCRPYSNGSFIYVPVFRDANCMTPIKEGIYRLKYDIYTDCVVDSLNENKEARAINPSQCNTKHMLYSKEFAIE